MPTIVIYGAGGFAREVAWLIPSSNMKQYEIACFISDTPEEQGLVINGIAVMSLEETRKRYPSASAIAAIGNPAGREIISNRAKENGFCFATIIHQETLKSEWIKIGEGTVICAGNILTTNIEIGRHAQINLGCTIGHDVIIGDYSTLSPGVHVSGRVHIGNRVYIGTGAVIIAGTSERPIVIEDDVVIGAGACVTRSLAGKQTYVGVPAKSIRTAHL
ncbi:MAG: acetyltransferase [Thermodesulfobacteriota bacterium]